MIYPVILLGWWVVAVGWRSGRRPVQCTWRSGRLPLVEHQRKYSLTDDCLASAAKRKRRPYLAKIPNSILFKQIRVCETETGMFKVVTLKIQTPCTTPNRHSFGVWPSGLGSE